MEEADTYADLLTNAYGQRMIEIATSDLVLAPYIKEMVTTGIKEFAMQGLTIIVHPEKGRNISVRFEGFNNLPISVQRYCGQLFERVCTDQVCSQIIDEMRGLKVDRFTTGDYRLTLGFM